ncbi:MAG: fused MFS/spermidine synthase [Nitrospirae bacterium]|nr:fused MFS/spermidine synthase [Nitrospirota bacterium]
MFNKIYLTVLCFLLFPLSGFALEPSEKLLMEKNSLYQYIAVTEDAAKHERYLRNNKKDLIQGGISLDAPDKLLFEYTRTTFVSLAFLRIDPGDVLFAGLGIGAMPGYMNRYYPEANIDAVEIDTDIVSVAKEYFYFKENKNLKVHAGDARQFIKRSKKKYDIIFLDAYQGDYIPFHLTTVEFLREVKSRLKDNGVVVSNILSPYRNKLFDSMIMTYKKVFPYLYIFKGKKSGNFIFVVTKNFDLKDKDGIEAAAKKLQSLRQFDFDLPETASRFEYSMAYEWSGANILTDDFAPVNLYKYQDSEAK